MDSMIYKPLEEYEQKWRESHFKYTREFFDELVKKSGVNIEENRKTVAQYNEYRENLKKLKKKLNWYRFFRVLMCITILLIPLVIWKMTPAIRKLREEIELADQKADELLEIAQKQMLPLNQLFTDRDALNLIEKTLPQLSFDDCFSAKKEQDMRINYDFSEYLQSDQSTIDVLSGDYNENPFLFENKVVHTMGTETYHGYKTISWTERYRGSDGKWHTRVRTQTLHATVVKPKPYYNNQVVLNYGSQGGPELSFSRDASHLDRKSEKEIERHVKKGEKKTEQSR